MVTASWFRGQPQPETADWFRGQPASSAEDAEIAGWFRGQPASAAKDPATVDWFKGQPASNAEDAEIAGWFRGQPAAHCPQEAAGAVQSHDPAAPCSSSASAVPSSSAGPCMQVYVNCSSGLLELDIQPSDTTEVPPGWLPPSLLHHLLALVTLPVLRAATICWDTPRPVRQH